MERVAEQIIAYGWETFIEDPDHDPEWIPLLPMVKAVYMTMKAA
jgi:PhoPQ-activated pathogenicity-related protein